MSVHLSRAEAVSFESTRWRSPMSRPELHHLPVRRRVPRFTAMAVAAVLVLASCGDDAEPTAEPATETTTASEETTEAPGALDTEVPDLCGLLTAEDFDAVTGEAADEFDADAATGVIRGTCLISSAAGFPAVFLGAYNESDREATLAMVDSEPVDDLGTEAYWDDTLGVVVPLEGKDWYLQVKAMGSDDNRSISLQAAALVLDRLQG
jgi:hypothetical protein